MISNKSTGTSRRRFLTAFTAAAATAIPASLAALAGRFLLGIRSSKTGGRTVTVGPVADFSTSQAPVERVVEFSVADGYLRADRRERIFVVRDGEKLRALSATCTHLGCGVSWDPAAGLFRCPCHGGTYRRDGTVASGPPPKPLAEIPIAISGADVTVLMPDET